MLEEFLICPKEFFMGKSIALITSFGAIQIKRDTLEGEGFTTELPNHIQGVEGVSQSVT